jgi:hypothetical protein
MLGGRWSPAQPKLACPDKYTFSMLSRVREASFKGRVFQGTGYPRVRGHVGRGHFIASSNNSNAPPPPIIASIFQTNQTHDEHSFIPQSRQSAKLFLQSSELGLPQPPPPPPIPTRGHTLWYSLYLCTVLRASSTLSL